jgi:class 3 adenylate cyclase/tetratricopeptide (TPR) repeat protein
VDVGVWLHGLGLDQYERAFRDNDVDARVLPGLTVEDLKEIGVASVGHRRLILQATAAMSASPPPTEAAATVNAETAAAAAHAPPQAERRQLTVMFVDLVGSTELSRRLDPEEMREVLRAFQNAVKGGVARFEGHVAKFLGDGVLCYFGWPRAHEDATERAVRAGLGLVVAMGRLTAPGGAALACRIGIATGPVVVGELIGEGSAAEEAVIGETPNLAARLQALAEPGAVVVAEGTRRLLGALFVWRDLGAATLKGFAEPVRAWRVLGEGTAEGRFEALHASGLTPLVGREHELALLLDRWTRVKEGEGQVVLLSGEPGIGKSRLVRALRERLEGEPHTVLGQFCSPYHANTALHPVVGLLERAAGLRHGDPPESQLDKLEGTLALAVGDVRGSAALLADLLGIPASDRYPQLELSPQQKKERTFHALLEQLAGLAARRPVLALYEDVHWADPTTLELLGRVVEQVQHLPVLVVATFRPEFPPPWAGHGHVSALTLNRLGRRQGAAVVERVAGGRALPAEVLEGILARTDGVPLFVEELTKTVIESGLLREEEGGYALTGPLPALAIPSTLQDSLMARLDRLAPVKEVAQIAACIGREFTRELLAAVVGLGQNELGDALGQLVHAGLVFPHGGPPEVSYAFKHALVRDAAYQSLLRSRRQQLHARIAQVLEERFPERATATPEIVAHHLSEAGLRDRAAAYWLRAGRLATGRSALAEAAAHLERGLETLASLPAAAERDRTELELQLALAHSLMPVEGWAAPKTARAYGRARALCEAIGDTRFLPEVLFGAYVIRTLRADLPAALESAQDLLDCSQRSDDPGAVIAGTGAVGMVLTHMGQIARARACFDRVMESYDPSLGASLTARFAIDRRLHALGCGARCSLYAGRPTRAWAELKTGIDLAERGGHQADLGLILLQAAELGAEARDAEAALAWSDRLARLAREEGYPGWHGMAIAVRGWAAAAPGEDEHACTCIRRGQEEWRRRGTLLVLPFFHCLLARLLLRADRPVEALADCEAGLSGVNATGERLWEPKLHAIEVARELGMKLLELRSATSLARHKRDRGQSGEAQRLVAPVYDWFTEGFDGPDLEDARALLDTLA